MFKSWLRKAMKQQGFTNESKQNQSRYKEGEVFISKNKKSGPAKSDVVGGDYVDFEEVD